MSKVLILGAGSSYGHGYSSVDSEIPPLITGFFTHPINKHLKKDYSELLEYLEKKLSLDTSKDLRINVEDIFYQIEPAWKLQIFEDFENVDKIEFKHITDYKAIEKILKGKNNIMLTSELELNNSTYSETSGFVRNILWLLSYSQKTLIQDFTLS